MGIRVNAVFALPVDVLGINVFILEVSSLTFDPIRSDLRICLMGYSQQELVYCSLNHLHNLVVSFLDRSVRIRVLGNREHDILTLKLYASRLRVHRTNVLLDPSLCPV
jgi:hypothetical protein